MKLTNRSRRAAILLGTIAALMSTVACSNKPKSAENSPAPFHTPTRTSTVATLR